MLRLVTFALALLFSLSSHANTLPDPLDLPAQKTDRAIISLMTDIAWAGSRLVAVGENGFILYSDDEGATWQQADVPVRVALTKLQFVGDRLGWAVGHDAVILHTQDGGESWQLQLSGRETGDKLLAAATKWQTTVEEKLAAEDLTAEQQDELTLQLDAAMLAVDEAQREIEVGPNRPFMDVFFRNEQEGYVVGAFGYFFSTKDGGKTWQDNSAVLPNYELLNLYGITELSGGEMIVVGEFGLVLVSDDGGESWWQHDLGYQGSLFGVYPGALADVGVAVGLRGNTFLTYDGGINWRQITPGKASILDMVNTADNRRVIFVGLAGSVAVVNLMTHKTEQIPVKTRAHFAAVEVTKGGSFVLVGSNGIMRINESGEVLPVELKMEAAK